MLDFETTVRTRQSIRKFLPTPMREQDIKQILNDAQNAPSACNMQPYLTCIVSGDTLQRLVATFKQRFEEGRFSPDFPFDQNEFTGVYEQRWRHQYAYLFTEAFGVAREDKLGRNTVTEQGITGYGAPHMAFLFMPTVGNQAVNIASDVGMYSQTFLLSLTARGFGGIPMLFLAMFADDVRRELGIADDYKLLHGIAFGYPDWDAQPNKKHLARVPVDETSRLFW